MKKKYTIKKSEDKKNRLTNIKVIPDDDLTLFRYRSFNEYTLSAFYNDEVWGSTANAFNDPYDIDFLFNKKEVIDYAISQLSKEEINIMRSEINTKNESDKITISKYIDEVYNENLKTLKSTDLIACFCAEPYSELMWAHYTDNGKGFMLEYDAHSLREAIKNNAKDIIELMKSNTILKDYFDDNQNYHELYDLLPIIYSPTKYDGTKFMKKIIDFFKELILESENPNENNFFKLMIDIFYNPKNAKIITNSIIFSKNSTWRYEKEWRANNPNHVILSANPDQKHAVIGYSRPVAIYLGEFMSNANKYILASIAYQKKIKIYQIYSKTTKKKRGLSKKLLSKDEVDKILKIY